MKWTYTMVRNMLLPRPFSKHLKRAGFHDCNACLRGFAGRGCQAGKANAGGHRADDLLHTIPRQLKAFVTEPKL